MRLIDADALCEYANNQIDKTVDANDIMRFPCVDAVPVVHGRWERHYSRPGVYADLCWHCSVCGGKNGDNWADHYNFCPSCGAKMDKEENE